MSSAPYGCPDQGSGSSQDFAEQAATAGTGATTNLAVVPLPAVTPLTHVLAEASTQAPGTPEAILDLVPVVSTMTPPLTQSRASMSGGATMASRKGDKFVMAIDRRTRSSNADVMTNCVMAPIGDRGR